MVTIVPNPSIQFTGGIQMRVLPLIQGIHKVQDSPRGRTLPNHTGAVTLITEGEYHVLVDTGGRHTFPQLVRGLEPLGIRMDQIAAVILTHFHLDHSYNISQFPGANVVAWGHDWDIFDTTTIDVLMGATKPVRFDSLGLRTFENVPKIPEIELLRTPGHTPDHLSVLVTDDNGVKIAIAGDAINEEFVTTNKLHAYAFNEGLYRQSAATLLKWADRIIPGHGPAFELE